MKELNPSLAFCIGSALKKKQNGVSLIFLRDTSFTLEIFLTCYCEPRKRKHKDGMSLKKKNQRENPGRRESKMARENSEHSPASEPLTPQFNHSFDNY